MEKLVLKKKMDMTKNGGEESRRWEQKTEEQGEENMIKVQCMHV
jgi:hypothetical protein